MTDLSSVTSRPATADWLVGGGEMGRLIRSLDWSASAIGPIETWPQSLRTALGICLSSRFPMAIWWGPDVIQFYNDGYRPFLGAKHPRSMGQRGDECWAEIWDVCGPLYHRVMTTAEATWSADLQLLMERNGYLEETYFTFSYSPIRGEEAEVLGNLITVTETTERVLGERRLRTLRDLGALAMTSKTSEEALLVAAQTLQTNTADVPFALLYLVDDARRSARLVAASNLASGGQASPTTLDLADDGAWPVGRVVASARSMTLDDLAAAGTLPSGPWTGPPQEALVLPLSAGDEVAGVLIAGVSPRRRLDDSYRSFYDLLAGQIATALSNARAHEVERKRTEALAALDRAKTQFFSNISHEFRTPLTLMLAPLEDLLAPGEHSVASWQRERLETAHRNSLRLLKLVNTLLDFSRIEAGRAEASYVPVDLARLTAGIASSFCSVCETAGLRLSIDCEPLREPVYIDTHMWESIVLNLLSNALKFTFEGGIDVTLAEVGGGAELRVRDTGGGIAARELPRIFERFHRVEGAPSRTHEGSGIGLALVQELANMHGGEIGVRSEPGRGSTFTVRLPFGSNHLPQDQLGTTARHADAAAPATAFVQEALGWLSTPGMEHEAAGDRASAGSAGEPPPARILVVDDNADMREYIARLLRPRWSAATATDGLEALEALKEQTFDLVVSDIMMPRMDGFALLKAIRADPSPRAPSVVLLSARAGEESRIDGVAAGADDYIVKPFSGAQLVAQVNAQLALRQARREAAREREELFARELEARREAESANRAKDEFLALLGHELRNPLAPILTTLQLMRLRGVQSIELDILERQAGHLTRLVDDLLDVSRITRGRIELRKERMELAEAVVQALETASPVLEQKGQRVDLQGVARTGLPVNADRERLAQIFSNLLTNAAKYSERGSRITLWSERAGDRVRLGVRDEGVGITPEMLDRVFDLFVQQPQTVARSEGGLGLGLAIVRNLTELHGGTVTVSSNGHGTGSEFVVELPAASPAPEEESTKSCLRSAAPDEARRILVVDDNRDAAVMLGTILRQIGHVVEIAHDGASALVKAKSFRPQVALVDIGLPVMDGYELAQRLREQAGPEEPLHILAVSGYGLDADRQRSANAGFQGHLTKPLDIRVLEAELLAMRESASPPPV